MLIAFAAFQALSARSPEQKSPALFSSEVGTFDAVRLPYRKALIASDSVGGKRALVLYLHGGPSRGDDNATQMKEDAVGVIYGYLKDKGIRSIMLVPQCPLGDSWGGALNGTLKELIDSYVESGEVDADHIYILGGSMGGTGTWSMVSDYPDLFAAAMPVAGAPLLADALSVVPTPIYTVMGTDDHLMSIPAVSEFVGKLQAFGGRVKLDIEPWAHKKTCTDSYTAERLDWVFSH